MCGIAGLIETDPGARRDGDITLMLSRIRHRGPDDHGVWSEQGVWLGHRRLSIVDLSAAGRQPMTSACGRYVIVYNGELYNTDEMRGALEAVRPRQWRGHSDTEVLLQTIADHGLHHAVVAANGMFAFALWDRETRTLSLARDRFGEKPLYYALTAGGGFAFASELVALEGASGVPLDISPDALNWYFERGYFPAPMTIYAGVRKLPPGHTLRFQVGGAPTVAPYWSISDVVRDGRSRPITDPAAAVDELEALLKDAVSVRMISDVPFGAFLSGGIDSAVIAALMQASSSQRIKTFTLGFDVPEFNEAEHARAVAVHLGTEHHEHVVTMSEALTLAPRIGAMMDEPLADSSFIPTYLVSQMARRDVTVCLSGDAGDEMFGGYRRYAAVPRMWSAMRRMPLRGLAARTLEAAPMPLLEAGLSFLKPVAERYLPRGDFADKIRRLTPLMRASSADDLYDRVMAAWTDPRLLVKQGGPAEIPWEPENPGFASPMERLQWHDTIHYLPGDILTKVDRASMAVSLEGRMPFLDPRVAAFAWRLPPDMKMANGVGKVVLREVLHRHVPRALIDRPKMGFGVPVGTWLRGDLREWASDLLSKSRLERQGLLNPEVASDFWARYSDGRETSDGKVWALLMLQSWLEARDR